jgi:hypothetical protein
VSIDMQTPRGYSRLLASTMLLAHGLDWNPGWWAPSYILCRMGLITKPRSLRLRRNRSIIQNVRSHSTLEAADEHLGDQWFAASSLSFGAKYSPRLRLTAKGIEVATRDTRAKWLTDAVRTLEYREAIAEAADYIATLPDVAVSLAATRNRAAADGSAR